VRRAAASLLPGWLIALLAIGLMSNWSIDWPSFLVASAFTFPICAYIAEVIDSGDVK